MINDYVREDFRVQTLDVCIGFFIIFFYSEYFWIIISAQMDQVRFVLDEMYYKNEMHRKNQTKNGL
jgi:hypothetical protein